MSIIRPNRLLFGPAESESRAKRTQTPRTPPKVRRPLPLRRHVRRHIPKKLPRCKRRLPVVPNRDAVYESYRLVGVSVSSLAYYCAPVAVMALSPVLFNERITARRAAGFLTVFAGAILVSVQTVGTGGSGHSMLCGWMSAAMHAVMVVASKKADRVDGLENSAVQLAASFVLTAVHVAATGSPLTAISPAEWPWAVALGVVNTGLGCYLYFSSYGGLPVQSVAVLGYLEPLSAVVMAAVFLGEALSPAQLLGAALILGGAVFGERQPRTATPAPPA